MSDFQNIAVIDIGKTNAKVVLLDRLTGKQIAVFTRPNNVLDTDPYPHYDIDGLWNFILVSLRDIQLEHRIDGISITTHGAAAALVDQDGLVLPVLDYEFDEPEWSGHEHPDFTETLSPELPMGLNLGAQIYWQSITFPEKFARTTAILTYPQYWAWKLTGVMASEVTSLGTHTDLWDPIKSDFSSTVDCNGWRKLFPPTKPANTVLGPILLSVAGATELPHDTPVTCGIHDSNASLMPYLDAGQISIISSGTWTIVMSVSGDTDGLDPARDCLANVDAFGRPVPTARFMGGREYAILMEGNNAVPSPTDIEKIVRAGAMILPGFVDGVGPFPAAVGKWTGAFENDAERAAGVALYMALMSKTCLSLAGTGQAIVIEGPLAKDEIYCGLLAALTGVPTYRSGDATGTSSGAAMLFGIVARDNLGALVAPLNIKGLAEYADSWAIAAEA